MENIIQVLIYLHATFGGVSLISGTISIIAKKGRKTHKKAGLAFYYSMLACGISAMLIAVLPNHRNPYLFSIGIFSLYFVLTGYRALNFKTKNIRLRTDKMIAFTMIITGFLMIMIPIVFTNKINIILAVFAIVGIIFSVKDLLLFKKPKQLQNSWLKLHIGKMIGGYIAATTAFVVVNNFFYGIYGWFIPGIIGGFIIAFWTKKINNRTVIG